MQVWPVIHAYLTKKKVKSIDCEEVGYLAPCPPSISPSRDQSIKICCKSASERCIAPTPELAFQTREKDRNASMQAYRLQQEGAVFVDPRVPWDFEKQRIQGAVSVPLFRGVAGKSAWDSAKRLVMAVGFAMKATGMPDSCCTFHGLKCLASTLISILQSPREILASTNHFESSVLPLSLRLQADRRQDMLFTLAYGTCSRVSNEVCRGQ